MLVDPSIEKMLPSSDCAYELVVLVSKRARQLVEGGQPMVADKAANNVSLACREIAQGKVVRVKGDKSAEIVIPKTKAARDAEKAARLEREEAERARELERAIQFEAIQAKANDAEEAAEEEEVSAVSADDLFEVVDDFEELPDEAFAGAEDDE